MLKAALEQLDKSNPEHYTSDGQPRVDVVSQLVGSEVSRKEITEAMLEPTVEPPAPAPVPTTGPELYEQVNAALEAKLAEYRTVKQELEKLQRQQMSLRRYAPPSTPSREERTKSVRSYVERQHEIRMAKAMANKAREAAHPMPKDTRSAMDKALQDRSNRNRPKF